MSAGVRSDQYFTARHHCPICDGHRDIAPGHGTRCYGYLHSDGIYAFCLPPGVLVGGEQVMPIEAATGNVYGRDGELHTVTAQDQRLFVGDLIVITTRATLDLPLTPEHPVLIARPKGDKWVEAGRLRIGDTLVSPRIAREQPAAAPLLPPLASPLAKIMPELLPSADLAYALGCYLADGNAGRGQVRWTVGKRTNQDRLIAGIRTLGLGEPTVRPVPGCTAIIICSTAAANWFQHNFGAGAANKRIPHWLMAWDAQALLAGIRTDGHYGQGGIWQLMSCSLSLLSAVWTLLVQQSERPRLRPYQRSSGYANAQPMWRLTWTPGTSARYQSDARQEGGRLLIPITRLSRRPYEGPVYNIAVADGESYLAHGITVHNCTREQYAGKLRQRPNAVGATFGHRLQGDCDCGTVHGAGPSSPARPHRPLPPSAPAREIEPVMLDLLFRTMLAYLPNLSSAQWEYLERRGEPDWIVASFQGYKAMPRTEAEAADWVLDLIGATVEPPEGETEPICDFATLVKMPGIFFDRDTGVPTTHHGHGIVIPARGEDGLIGGLVRMQLIDRGDGVLVRPETAKYATYRGGGADFYALAGTRGPNLFVTEGIHKAYVIAECSDLWVMGISGAHLRDAHQEVIARLRPDTVVEALDMDKLTNADVALGRLVLCDKLMITGFDVRTAVWDATYKGLDDLLKAGMHQPPRLPVHLPALRQVSDRLRAEAEARRRAAG